MSEREDFPHLADARRAYRRQVALTTTGVLVGVTAIVVRFANHQDRVRDLEGSRALERALAEMPPPTAPVVAPDHPPVELVVAIGGRQVDVDGAPIAVGDGRTIELVAQPEITFGGAELSFRYPPTFRVRTGGSTVVTGSEAMAELAVVDVDGDATEDLATMIDGYSSTGQVSHQEPVTVSALGKRAVGARLLAAALVIELYSLPFARNRRLRIVLTGTHPDADLEPVRRIVATIKKGRAAPTPELVAIVRGGAGGELARTDVTVGHEATLGEPPVALTVTRRELVRERLSGISFEHPPELTAIALVTAFPAVQLRDGERGIQIFAPGIDMDPGEMLDTIGGGMVSGRHPVERAFGGTTYQGAGGRLSLGTVALETEVFAFERGGRAFVAALQYPAGDGDALARLAAPVLTSVE